MLSCKISSFRLRCNKLYPAVRLINFISAALVSFHPSFQWPHFSAIGKLWIGWNIRLGLCSFNLGLSFNFIWFHNILQNSQNLKKKVFLEVMSFFPLRMKFYIPTWLIRSDFKKIDLPSSLSYESSQIKLMRVFTALWLCYHISIWLCSHVSIRLCYHVSHYGIMNSDSFESAEYLNKRVKTSVFLKMQPIFLRKKKLRVTDHLSRSVV